MVIVYVYTLQLFSKVTHLIPLPTVCESYDNLHYHEGIVELVLSSAAQVDPQNLGLHYYKSNQPPGDIVSQGAFMERLKIYDTITKTLKNLLKDQLQPVAPSSAVPAQPGPPPAKPDKEELPNPRKEVNMILVFLFCVHLATYAYIYLTSLQFDDMVTLVLRSDDELLHVTLYSWFISERMGQKLVEVSSFQLWLAMSELT